VTLKSSVLFSYAFRTFFLVNGLFAILVVLVWVSSFHGSGLGAMTPLLHGHEMLIGFALAAVAGFSLTAVANWTGRPAVNGAPLALLALCWLAGRFAMFSTGWLPYGLVALLDMLFPVLLGILLGREIIVGRNRRNYALVIIIFVVVMLNSLYHLGVIGWLPGGERLAVYLLIHTLLLLVVIIAGRIVPNFTSNWLRKQGLVKLPVSDEMTNRVALSLTIGTGLAAGFMPFHPLTGVLAFAAAVMHGFRLSRWRAFATTSNPLLFVLHVAYAWIPIGYFLLGCSVFEWVFTPTAALHSLTTGAIGSMVLAVTTRVALGHTGRPLLAARTTVFAYWVFMLAVSIRVFGPFFTDNYILMIDISALGWALSFGIFTWVYWPILTQPRVQ
jgi:uncharacterized protein involved in response to NO